ncbi:MAG: chloride channel protein [Firmicutes bacterium]|nr:chloride channel protein [Bacillota bacterium]
MKRYTYKDYLAHVVPCLGYGLLCGSVAGTVIFFFKLAAQKVEGISRKLYGIMQTSPRYLIIGVLALILLAAVMVWLHKQVPEAKGGGIPRSEGILRGILSFRWLKTLLGTIAGSMISFFCGLPVGSEGPAVMIGTSLGSMCGNVSKNKAAWNRYIMSGGAGAGFAVATGAPFAAMLFVLEEVHKRFTPMLILIVSMSVLAATYMNQLLCAAFSVSPELFHIGALADFELSHMGYLLVLGFIMAGAVGIFDGIIEWFDKLTAKGEGVLPKGTKMMVVFLITGILGMVFAQGVYSGHHVIEDVLEHNMSMVLLCGILVVRLLMMLLITNSGATGGIFIPTLAIGALVSALAAKLLMVFGMPEALFDTVVLLGMCAFIGGTLRAPFTAAALFVELTGQFTNFFFVALVIFIVHFITEVLNQEAFYEKVVKSMKTAENQDKEAHIEDFEMTISNGAFVVGKTVRDVMWPASSAIVSVIRAESHYIDMDSDGEKKLYAGDTIVLRVRYYDEDEVKNYLYGLVGREQEIRCLNEEE